MVTLGERLQALAQDALGRHAGMLGAVEMCQMQWGREMTSALTVRGSRGLCPLRQVWDAGQRVLSVPPGLASSPPDHASSATETEG